MTWAFQPLTPAAPQLLGNQALTLAADQGSLAFNGQTISFGRSFLASQGSYSLNGQDATLVYTPAGLAGRVLISDTRGLISSRTVISSTREVVSSRTVI